MSGGYNRRRFVKRIAFTAAAGWITAGAGLSHGTEKSSGVETSPARRMEEKNALPIVDTHQHLWDTKRFRLPWIEPDTPLAKNFLIEDYLQATAGLNVVKAIYMEVDVDPAQQQAEADYITEVCQSGKTPTVAAVVSGRPASENFANYARQFRDSRYIKGIRQVLHNKGTPAGYCLDKRFIAGIQSLGELGLSFDLCMRAEGLQDAVKLIGACPKTSFILDHCGNAKVGTKDLSQWKRDIAVVAKHDHVVGKISGIVASAKPGQWRPDDLAPIINHTLEVFGPDRVMFGGDWPVCTLGATYKEWLTALKTIVHDRPESDQRKLFHDNAVRFYKLA